MEQALEERVLSHDVIQRQLLQLKARKRRNRLIVEIIVLVVLLAVLAYFYCGVAIMRTSDMYPAICKGDVLFFSRLYLDPAPGDVVVVRKGTAGGAPRVGRILAIGGQKVEIDYKAGKIYIDGGELDEPYAIGKLSGGATTSFSMNIPEGMVFILADNRVLALEKREASVSCIARQSLQGKITGLARFGMMH